MGTDGGVGLQGKISGTLSGVYLHDIVQLLGMTGRTVTVVLEHQGHLGRMFFRDGDLLHAEADAVEGEDAVLHLLRWSDAHFSIEDGIGELPRETISCRTEAVVLSAVARLDELSRRPYPADSISEGIPPLPNSPPVSRRSPKAPVRLRRRNRKKEWVLASLPFITLALVLTGSGLILHRLGGLPDELPSPILPSRQAPRSPRIGWEVKTADLQMAEVMANFPDPEEIPGPAESDDRPRKLPPVDAGQGERSGTRPVPAPSIAGFGKLRLIVDPWAEVFVDGRRVGETPLQEILLPAGEHTLALSNRDFAGLIREAVRVLPGQSLTKRYSFRDFGFLRVVVRPWAEVYVDDRLIGQTPLRDLKVPVGQHRLVLRHPERGERSQLVWIEKGRSVMVRVDM